MDCEERKRPVIIHRAILGSVERMMAVLTENYGGKWYVGGKGGGKGEKEEKEIGKRKGEEKRKRYIDERRGR